jgi:hypothetical protein
MTWAGVAPAQGPESRSQRHNELDEVGRPPLHIVMSTASSPAARQAVDEERWIEGAQRRQLEVFYEGVLNAEAQGRSVRQRGQVKARCPYRSWGWRRWRLQPGGDHPTRIKGDPRAVNPSSGAGGKYPFMPGTWGGYGGYARARDAPESVQDEKFQQVYGGGAGSSHWGC